MAQLIIYSIKFDFNIVLPLEISKRNHNLEVLYCKLKIGWLDCLISNSVFQTVVKDFASTKQIINKELIIITSLYIL